MDKRGQILEAAARSFLKMGYADTSLDEIVVQSGVAKQTIYNYFKDKDVLFKAVIDFELNTIALSLQTDWYKLGLEDFLLKVGKLQLKSLQDPHTAEVLRLVVKESRRFPELQSTYAESVPDPFLSFVCNYMKLHGTVGKQRIPQQDDALLRSKVWCFRAALTGYATVANLSPLADLELPNKSRFLAVLATLFAQVFRTPSILKGESKKVPYRTDDHAEIEKFLRDSSASLGEKRLAILIGALKMFSSRDFSETSMDDVAAAAGVSKQTVYKHFGSKNLLYQDLLRVVVDRLQRPLSAPTISDKTEPRRIANYCKALLDGTRQTGLEGYFRTVIGASQVFPAESGLLLLYLFDFGRQELQELIQADYPNSRIDILPSTIALRGMIGGFLLLRYIYIVGESSYVNEEYLISIIENILQSIGSENAA